MKATLEFNLPDDQYEFDLANKASDLASLAWDFQQYLRGQWKYAETPDTIEKIRDKWIDMKGDRNIDLDELMR